VSESRRERKREGEREGDIYREGERNREGEIKSQRGKDCECVLN